MWMATTNTSGDEECYYPNISYHHNQPELQPPSSWCSFTEPGTVCLEDYRQGPNWWYYNYYTLTVPENAPTGEYFAYVETCKVPDGNIGTCYATTIRFEI